MVVAFTGYRPEKMPFQESKRDKHFLAFRSVLSRVITRLIELGGTYFISCVARGFCSATAGKTNLSWPIPE